MVYIAWNMMDESIEKKSLNKIKHTKSQKW